MNKNIKIFILFLTFFIVITEFFIFRNYLTHSFIFVDDTNCCRLYKGIEIFKNPVNGAFIPSVLDRIFGANLPFILNIHPSFFKSFYFSSIESVVLLFFSFIISFLISKEINIFTPIIFIFSSSIMLFTIQQQPYTLFVYDGFFRMILPTIFAGIFLLILYNEKKNTTLNLILAIVLLFFCSISNEFTCIFLLIGFLLSLIIVIHKKYDNKLITLIYFIITVLGFTILIKTGMFTRKSEFNVYDLNFLKSILIQIPDFLHYYVKYVFINHILEYSLLIFQIIYLSIKLPNDKNKNRIITYGLCFIIGCLLFFFSLIALGKEHYNENNYFVAHEDIHMMYSFLLYFINFALLNIIIRYKFIKKHILCFILIGISAFLIYKNFLFYTYFVKDEIDYLKLKTYQNEKIIRLSNLYDKQAYLDKEDFDNTYFWGFYYNLIDKKPYFLYSYSPYIAYLNQFNNSKKIKNGWIFTDIDVVKAEFKNNGGFFSKKELENPNFNNLLNEDFILNKTN